MISGGDWSSEGFCCCWTRVSMSVCLAPAQETHPPSSCSSSSSTSVLCFHQESSESRHKLQCKREDLLFIGVCDRRDAMGRCSTRVALLALLIGQILAGPGTSSSHTCQDQKALHERMDGVEERLESGVQKLQAELDLLMEELEAREWSPLLDGARIDLLDEPPNPPT
ncbi:uncharacterized protein LOC120460883 isoform X2 [Pimephales promelas]|uniref:uncharacterized protein LOC120460883 isoform X2 n=1 Tax=Pimephales promelas TaxID=90988 RepID=UPI001955B8D5|nr:uncharacterized protein LOC120460883 isoform X2 [Pimephales promelas]